MNLRHQTITDQSDWNKIVLDLPMPHVLQSWEWGLVKRQHNWEPTRLVWMDQEHPVAAAQILRRALPGTPWGVAYVPKGPVLDYTNATLLDRVLTDLEQYARHQRAILIKIDPDVNRPEVKDTLLNRGWRTSGEQIQFRNTALLDVTPSEQDLLMAMKSKTRYNIRLSGRKGTIVRPGDVQDIEMFYEMYAETGERDGFLIRPLGYYRDAWQTFIEAGLAQMLLADVEGETVAGVILFRFGATAWFMIGASTDVHRNCMPNYALQWEAIRWAKSVGCTVYDMWGAPNVLEPEDALWGVWRFKEGFGAQFAPHIGAHDYPALRLLYWAYKIVLPRYLQLLRRRDREPSV